MLKLRIIFSPGVVRVEWFDFYDQVKEAYTVVMSGEMRKYGNIILKKGVINR
ncbi:MAG TPA: hypothetical protein DCO79_07490 [Spirochaeta sp.]|nr:hypothetical protein [Spirochaeta sp.]